MNRIRLALLAIAVITIVSGATQLVAPALVLRVVGGEATTATTHSFAIIGMFMVLFGGLLWQSLRAPTVLAVPLFWAALQKIGAALAVGLGVRRGIFSTLALAVASFDLLSGALALWYWNRVRES
ncbi:MAG TPA: hypothetical protein VF929_08060 [Gemmatimonadaceae bacterium]